MYSPAASFDDSSKEAKRKKGAPYFFFFSSTSLGLIWCFMGLFLHSSLEFVPFTVDFLGLGLGSSSTFKLESKASPTSSLLDFSNEGRELEAASSSTFTVAEPHTVRINKSWSSSGCSREKLD